MTVWQLPLNLLLLPLLLLLLILLLLLLLLLQCQPVRTPDSAVALTPRHFPAGLQP
jgi:hypothetical protein